MNKVSLLSSIYQKRLLDTDNLLPLDQVVDAFCKEAPLDGRLLEKAIECNASLASASPWVMIDKWRETLTLLLILRAKGLLQPCRHLVVERVHHLRKYALWKEFQLVSVFQALVAYLLELPSELPCLFQLQSGACPLENGGHWIWGEIPHPTFHAELGLLWCLYADLTGNAAFLKGALKLAEWQMSSLDHNFAPLSGLFSQESDAAKDSLLIYNFLLFDAIARAEGRSDLSYASQKQLDHLSALSRETDVLVPPHAIILASWNGSKEVCKASTPSLSSTFIDRQLALAGCRFDEGSAFSTLFGGGSGMGCFHRQDVQVVNFGPQHLPLGDCRGFGIEGGNRLLEAHVKKIASAEGEYVVEGVSRMASRPKDVESPALFRQGGHGGIWIDVIQRFEKGALSIDTVFNHLSELSSIAFVFFVKAPTCLVGGKKVVRPRSFERYQGSVQGLQFQGKHSAMKIEALQGNEMHVIPLGGGKNFWGADFLVAYLCSDVLKEYSWILS